MAALEPETTLGRFEGIGRTPGLLRAAREAAEEASLRGPVWSGFVEIEGARAYLKLSALRGRTSVRYATKRALLRAPLPRLREFGNLRWLREHGFLAPEPLAAGAWWRGGLPRSQFLATREVPGTVPLDRYLGDGPPPVERAAVLDEIARETARMHASGFVHRDLHPRNVLVADRREPGDGRRVWYLDCWKGGARAQLRGPAYDLACLAPDEPRLLEEDERRQLLETYAAERSRLGRAVHLARLLQAVERERR